MRRPSAEYASLPPAFRPTPRKRRVVLWVAGSIGALALVITLVMFVAISGASHSGNQVGSAVNPTAAPAPTATSVQTQPAAVAATACPSPVSGPAPSASLNTASPEAQFVAAVGESTGDDLCTTVHKAFDKVYAQAFSDEDPAYLPFFWCGDCSQAVATDQDTIAQEKQRQDRLLGEHFAVTAVIASSPTSFTVEGDYGWTGLPTRHGQLTMTVNPDQSSPARWIATCFAVSCP